MVPYFVLFLILIALSFIFYHIFKNNNNSNNSNNSDNDTPSNVSLLSGDTISQISGVVAFVSDSCGFCKQTKPIYEQASQQSQTPFYYFNYQNPSQQQTLNKYKVTGFPDIKRFEKGKVIKTFTDDRTVSNFVKFAQ